MVCDDSRFAVLGTSCIAIGQLLQGIRLHTLDDPVTRERTYDGHARKNEDVSKQVLQFTTNERLSGDFANVRHHDNGPECP